MKKRIFSFVLTMCLLFLSACSAKEKTPGETKKQASKPSQTQNAEPSTSKSGIILNGAPLKDYKIIYSSDDLYSKFAAKNLQLYLSGNFGVKPMVAADSTAEAEYEILIGNTNRSINIDASLKGETYGIMAKDKKILLQAEGYMVGGAARGFLDLLESTPKSDGTIDLTIDTKPIIKNYVYKQAKSALLFIGDGMGRNHIDWALSDGCPMFYAFDMPNIGEAVTYSYSVKPLNEAQYTDSAAGGTALSTGYKTKNGTVGLDHNMQVIKNIRELAAEKGANTAVLTTDVITGATPAAFLTHTTSRDNTDDIQKQIDTLKSEGKLTIAEGSIAGQLMITSQSVLEKISQGDSSFFMMLEEGYIDKNSHNNDAVSMISTVERFNETIANAMQFTLIRGDTVLIITADHETGGVIKTADGFSFTSTEHTNRNVPLFAMGYGTEIFAGATVDNTDIPKFIAKIYGEESFGDAAASLQAAA